MAMLYLKVMLILQLWPLLMALMRLWRNRYPTRIDVQPQTDVVGIVINGALVFWTVALLCA